MIEIQKFLKSKNITVVKFAKDLGLSRNTAMLYISLYEKGEIIHKEKYKNMFDFLFTDTNKFDFNYFCITHNDIKQKLNQLEKIEEIILDTKISLDVNRDPGMPAFIKAEAYNKIKKVFKND